MPIAKEEWYELTWAERIDLLCLELGLTEGGLARLLGAPLVTLHNWQRNNIVSDRKYRTRMERLGILRKKVCPPDIDFHVYASASVDANAVLLESALKSRNKLLLSMSVHSIAVKMASLITERLKKLVILRTHAVFNSYPAKEHLRVEVVGMPREIFYDITITHSPANLQYFTLAGDAYVDGSKVDYFAAYATDEGVRKSTTKVIQTISSLCNQTATKKKKSPTSSTRNTAKTTKKKKKGSKR